VALCRAMVEARLREGEKILAEHHAVLGHLRLTESVLREPEQGLVSLYATTSRLVRIQAHLGPGQSATLDDRDATTIDDLPWADVTAIHARREVRGGEAAAGLVTLGVALLGYSWLQVTGPALALVGILGVIHAVFFPTRHVALEARGQPAEASFRVPAVGKKTGRALLAVVRARVAAAAPSAARGAA